MKWMRDGNGAISVWIWYRRICRTFFSSWWCVLLKFVYVAMFFYGVGWVKLKFSIENDHPNFDVCVYFWCCFRFSLIIKLLSIGFYSWDHKSIFHTSILWMAHTFSMRSNLIRRLSIHKHTTISMHIHIHTVPNAESVRGKWEFFNF